MDPDECLKRIRENLSELDKNFLIKDDSMENIIEGFKDLDEWIMKGGFLPGEWAKKAYGGELPKLLTLTYVSTKLLTTICTVSKYKTQEQELTIAVALFIQRLMQTSEQVKIGGPKNTNGALFKELLLDTFPKDHTIWSSTKDLDLS